METTDETEVDPWERTWTRKDRGNDLPLIVETRIKYIRFFSYYFSLKERDAQLFLFFLLT